MILLKILKKFRAGVTVKGVCSQFISESEEFHSLSKRPISVSYCKRNRVKKNLDFSSRCSSSLEPKSHLIFANRMNQVVEGKSAEIKLILDLNFKPFSFAPLFLLPVLYKITIHKARSLFLYQTDSILNILESRT